MKQDVPNKIKQKTFQAVKKKLSAPFQEFIKREGEAEQEACTDRGQPAAALADGGAAADEADDEEQRPHGDDDHGGDQRVHVLEEVIVVIVRDEHVGPHVAQDACCCLQQAQKHGQFLGTPSPSFSKVTIILSNTIK